MVALSESQMKNLIGQILYCCAEGGILNELGIKIALQGGNLNDIERNGYNEIADTIGEFLNDVQKYPEIYEIYED